jgi:prepilin-type N-terminal cleavage/methylation domain-containing protein
MKRTGFTLLEMLVGLTLMALLTIVLAGSMRSGLDVTGRVEAKAEDTHALVAAHRAFHTLIESAFPLRSDDARAISLRFDGDGKSLELIGPSAPQQLGGLITRGIRLDNGEMALIGARGWRRRVATLSSEATLSYFGAPERGSPPRWLTQWKDRASFPLLVRLRVTGWPDAVSRPRLREAIR